MSPPPLQRLGESCFANAAAQFLGSFDFLLNDLESCQHDFKHCQGIVVGLVPSNLKSNFERNRKSQEITARRNVCMQCSLLQTLYDLRIGGATGKNVLPASFLLLARSLGWTEESPRNSRNRNVSDVSLLPCKQNDSSEFIAHFFDSFSNSSNLVSQTSILSSELYNDHDVCYGVRNENITSELFVPVSISGFSESTFVPLQSKAEVTLSSLLTANFDINEAIVSVMLFGIYLVIYLFMFLF